MSNQIKNQIEVINYKTKNHLMHLSESPFIVNDPKNIVLSPELEGAYQDYLEFDKKCSRQEFIAIIEKNEELPESITTKIKATSLAIIESAKDVALAVGNKYDKLGTFEKFMLWNLIIHFFDFVLHALIGFFDD